MYVPFNNLKAQHQSLGESLNQAIQETIEESQYIKGAAVASFEKLFAEAVGIRNCISTGNCTDALFASLKMLGTQANDEIITPAFSWISTAETISLCGAKPVFADVDPALYTITAETIKSKITSKTKGVVAVHLYGQCAPISEIRKLCDLHGLFLIEDCAQAQLTQDNQITAGTIGEVGVFSFYPTKNLGACGDAGCMVTSSDELAEKLRRFCNHGALKKDDHTLEGFNSRMDSLQAAILIVKLQKLSEWNKRRNQLAEQYHQHLKSVSSITLPFKRDNTTHTFHLYVIRARLRNELKMFLEHKGIQTQIHFPSSLPHLEIYAHLAQHEFYPVASALQNEVLSLPLYPEMTIDQLEYVCHCIKEFYISN